MEYRGFEFQVSISRYFDGRPEIRYSVFRCAEKGVSNCFLTGCTSAPPDSTDPMKVEFGARAARAAIDTYISLQETRVDPRLMR